MRIRRLASTFMDTIPEIGFRMPPSSNFLSGLGEDTTSFSAGDLTTFGTGLLSIWDQQQLYNLNLDRASKGLAPIQIQNLGVPQPGVQIGLSQDTQTLVLLGIAAVLAFAFIGSRR